jgi:Na+-transporting methylmalonyl-CoA/oxaloacetate decarboxylase gamma subunit
VQETIVLIVLALLILFPSLMSELQTWRVRRAMRRVRPLYRVDDDRRDE